jgi:hypothetical protein
MDLTEREVNDKITDRVYPHPLKDVLVVVWILLVCTDDVEIRKAEKNVGNFANDEKHDDPTNKGKPRASFVNA